jgi:lambda repressor-like predicted transcriptional regulator
VLVSSPAVPPRIPRYDLVTELFVSALARRAGLEPDQFRAWTRGGEKPPEWFEQTVRELVEMLVVDGEFGRLTSQAENSTIRPMRTQIAEARVGRPLKHMDHPLIAALAERGITLAEEAKAVKRSPTAVRNYLYPASEPSSRPIPRDLAELWRKKYGVPMSTWKRFRD